MSTRCRISAQDVQIAPSWPGLLYRPGTYPTGVRGHSRHIIIGVDRAARRPSMPWREVSVMDERREFVRLAMQPDANRRELCRRFGIHPDKIGRASCRERM